MNLEFLFTVAQIAVAYAGFSTLIAVIASSNVGNIISSRIYYMLLLSLITISFSLVPSVIVAYGVSETIAWRISSTLYAISWMVYWINALRTIPRFFGINSQGMSYLNKFHTYVLHPGSILALIFCGLGFFDETLGAIYATALFITLYMSGYLFYQIVMSFSEASNDT